MGFDSIGSRKLEVFHFRFEMKKPAICYFQRIFIIFQKTFCWTLCTFEGTVACAEEVLAMATLFMANVPYNCNDIELATWVESTGIEVRKVRLIKDLVAGVSPSFAYVEITEKVPVADAVRQLNGHNIRERVIMVSVARKGAAA
jgi:hypothetical protein